MSVHLIPLILALCMCLSSCTMGEPTMHTQAPIANVTVEPAETDSVDAGVNFTVADTGNIVPYVTYNDNVPLFTEDEKTTDVFETYSDLDELGRCGVAYANICQELMPTEERGEIGMIKPSGWHTVRYDDIISDKYLYNRCHLIGFQLAGENANEKNLITGTRYLNVEGMLPFENQVADYVHETNNHVLYRVTPLFEGENLVAHGVLMEAWSVEDNGEGCSFCVVCPNVQPGIRIDYLTGDSVADDTMIAKDTVVYDVTGQVEETAMTYILNTRTMKFHLEGCENAKSIADYNREESNWSRDALINAGYSPCGSCKP